MSPRRALPTVLGLLLAGGLPLPAPADPGLPEPVVTTHDDGRMPIRSLYQAYGELTERGWALDVIGTSRPAGTDQGQPIIALRSPGRGPAAWFIAGIHGEEPAGAMALAQSVDALGALGERLPVVLLPLLNPHGYVRNWRYLNRPDWAPGAEVQSVGDSSHRLPDERRPERARATAASSPEADAIAAYVLATARDYPPRYSIDLHEDNLLEAGYVYSQGALGAADPLAARAVDIIRAQGIPVQMEGETRFGEPIVGGIIGPVTDSSIDELMSAPWIVVDTGPQPGPRASTVLVLETPARDVELERRVGAHQALIRELAARLEP